MSRHSRKKGPDGMCHPLEYRPREGITEKHKAIEDMEGGLFEMVSGPSG